MKLRKKSKFPLPWLCHKCGQRILLVVLKSGRIGRVNREKVMSADQDRGTKLVSDDGRVIVIEHHREGFGSLMYMPHWRTCGAEVKTDTKKEAA